MMAESSDLIGLSKYLLSVFAKSGGKCYDLSYDAILATLLESRYTGNISEFEVNTHILFHLIKTTIL